VNELLERNISLLAPPPRSASATARSLKKGGVAERLIKIAKSPLTQHMNAGTGK
jgi:hypothetical protein